MQGRQGGEGGGGCGTRETFLKAMIRIMLNWFATNIVEKLKADQAENKKNGMYENTLPANEVSNVVQQEAASGDKVGLLTKDRILMIKCPHEELILPIVVLFIIIIMATCQTESPP